MADDHKARTNNKTRIKTRLEEIMFFDDKWCYFHCQNIITNEPFVDSGKLYYLGDAVRNSNIDISPWDEGGFMDVVRVIIKQELVLVWIRDSYNWFPDHLEGDLTLFRSTLEKLALEYNSD